MSNVARIRVYVDEDGSTQYFECLSRESLPSEAWSRVARLESWNKGDSMEWDKPKTWSELFLKFGVPYVSY